MAVLDMLQMHKLGFTNIDGVDPSPEMLECARAKNIYSNLIKDFLGANRLDISDSMWKNKIS